MGDSRTENVLIVNQVAGGRSRVIGHGLFIGRKGFQPTFIERVQGSEAIVVTAYDTVAVTFTNLGYDAASAVFRVRFQEG